MARFKPMQKKLQQAAKKFDLTDREQEIIALFSSGASRKKIASELSISIWTVRFHASNIFKKTGTHSALGVVSVTLLN